jgi:ubiquitin-small subunit ribosomal protein S27Ae
MCVRCFHLQECYHAGICAEDARVVYGGLQLAEDSVLSTFGVQEGSSLQVLGRLDGGAKKRKKKTYTKPKKAKHVHKSVKLRVLKYYSVDDSGKVTRTRKTCPTCGPGIFMATHTDRFHCGACAMTFMYNKA